MPIRFLLAAMATIAMTGIAHADPESDQREIARLDTAYQAAVARNDAAAMADILHPEMILVVGRGIVVTREQLLESARTHEIAYDEQVEDEGTQIVRLYGEDTAIVTARLWLKGTRKDGSKLDKRLWFSDTYVRTTQGWKYAFGQSSIELTAS
ncbi:MAG: nuclear transport factor 2 family protein [Hyphomonadaceae bacterium]